MTAKDIEAKTKTVSATTSRKTGNTFYVVWNAFMDIIYLLAIMAVVSIAIYVAYVNGIDHPAIMWAGEKINAIWLNVGQYFNIVE